MTRDELIFGLSDLPAGCRDLAKDLAGHDAAQRVTIEQLREALRSIAANTCCGPCHEAKLVARQALEEGKP